MKIGDIVLACGTRLGDADILDLAVLTKNRSEVEPVTKITASICRPVYLSDPTRSARLRNASVFFVSSSGADVRAEDVYASAVVAHQAASQAMQRLADEHARKAEEKAMENKA